MNWPALCAAVIPCLNEETTVGSLVSGTRDHLSTIIVVDDGSTDKTSEAAERAGAHVLRNPSTAGKGAALREGWSFALKSGFSWALSLDGDGQHAPEDIPAFFDCAERRSPSLIVGNRMNGASSMPWFRRLVNRWMSARIEQLTGAPVPDSQCGFRLMRLDSWAAHPGNTHHFEIESEVLVRFLLQKLPVEFVPIQVIYKNEQSKIHPLQDSLRWFRWWRQARELQREAASSSVAR